MGPKKSLESLPARIHALLRQNHSRRNSASSLFKRYFCIIWHGFFCRAYAYWHGFFPRTCACWYGFWLAWLMPFGMGKVNIANILFKLHHPNHVLCFICKKKRTRAFIPCQEVVRTPSDCKISSAQSTIGAGGGVPSRYHRYESPLSATPSENRRLFRLIPCGLGPPQR